MTPQISTPQISPSVVIARLVRAIQGTLSYRMDHRDKPGGDDGVGGGGNDGVELMRRWRGWF